MKRINKFLVTAVLAAAVLTVGCSKPPVQEMDNARAAMKAAQDSGAEKCAGTEYAKAKAALESAEAKVAEAEKGGSKSELYKQAKTELLQAVADFEKAKAVAADRSKVNEKAQAELDAYKKNLAASSEDGAKYSDSYKAAQTKINDTQALIDKCEGEKALAMLKDATVDAEKIQAEVVEGKAAEMKADSSRQATLKADVDASGNAVAAAVEELAKYKVLKGDSLWKISKKKYKNPFMWPLIYWANQTDIKDPDLIFPGQVFKIRKVDSADKAKAVDYAKHRGPWSLFDGK